MENRNVKIGFKPPDKRERLLSYILKYHRQFIITAITGIFFNSAIVLGPIFQGKLLDAAVTSKDAIGLLKAGLAFIGVTLLFQVARFFKRYYVRDMANRMSGDMRVGILESILHTDLNTMEKQKTGDMMSTTISDVDIVIEAIRKTITELWDTGVLMLAYWVTLMFYDVKITLIAAIPIPFVIILTQLMRKKVQAQSKLSRKATSKTTVQIRKMISQINILRLYGREEAELKRLKEKLDVQAHETTIVTVFQNGLAPIYSSLASIGIVIVIFFGGNRVISGSWTIGTFTAYITMFIALAVRTTSAAKVFNLLQGAKASWERVKNLLIEDDFDYGAKASTLKPKEIKVENLKFKYPTSKEPILKNISFNVSSGMIIGITGSVGSGKSALGLALTGLYDYDGKIYYDYKELHDIENEKILASISYMGHDSFLFSDTLENNITWNDNDEEKLVKVLKIADLNKDIEGFENKINSQVGEKGKKVSGGQRQRISLARALYKDSNIVILDDPFSAVDIKTEAEIIQELRKNVEGRTIFIFSHRLDAFKYTDRVLVLDKGEIVQTGTHKELSNSEGIYNKILDSQQFLGGGVFEE